MNDDIGHRMTPHEYYSEFVLGNFVDFEEDRANLRKAFNAAVSAFQLADQFYEYFKRHDPSKIEKWVKKTDLLKFLANVEPGFVTVQSVATVYKHLYLSAAHYDTSSPGALRLVARKNGISIGEQNFCYPPQEIMVKRRDGTTVNLHKCLTGVVTVMWPTLLYPPDTS